jgi:hypothetical protein
MLARIGRYLFLHMPRSGGVAWIKTVAPLADEHTVILLGAQRHLNIYDIERWIAPMSAFPHKYILMRNPVEITRSAINMLACLTENPDFWTAAEQQQPALRYSMSLFNRAKQAGDYEELLNVLFTHFIPSDDGSIVRPMVGLYADEFKILDHSVYAKSFELFMTLEYGIPNPPLPRRCNQFHHTLGQDVVEKKPEEVRRYVGADLDAFYSNNQASMIIENLHHALVEGCRV